MQHQKTKPRIHQFTNSKCCIKAREPFKPTFLWCFMGFLWFHFFDVTNRLSKMKDFRFEKLYVPYKCWDWFTLLSHEFTITTFLAKSETSCLFKKNWDRDFVKLCNEQVYLVTILKILISRQVLYIYITKIVFHRDKHLHMRIYGTCAWSPCIRLHTYVCNLKIDATYLHMYLY